jgi:hypothetical protein
VFGPGRAVPLDCNAKCRVPASAAAHRFPTRSLESTSDQRLQAGRDVVTDMLLAESEPPSHAPAMFVMSEAEAAAIRTAYEQRGELSAAVELRRRFPGIASTAQAQECARIIATWKPLPKLPTARTHRQKTHPTR